MISVANDCLIPDELAEINAGLADARAKDAAKRQERQSHNLALALRAAAAGIPVFPCSDYDKAPRKGHSFKTASRDAALIEAWWAEHPGSVAGYLPGSVGLLALDGDRHVDATGKIANDGVANVCRLFEAHGASDLLEHVPAVLTPNKGVHFLLQRPPGGPPISNRRGKLPKGIDVRCDGGYLILEGSIISDGRQYTAANKGLLWALENRAFPPAPAFVLAAIAAPEVNSPPVDLTGDVTADHAAFFQAKVKSVSELFGRTPHGERNNMLTRYTAMLAQLAGMGWGPASAIEEAMLAECLKWPETKSHNATGTINRQIKWGMANPGGPLARDFFSLDKAAAVNSGDPAREAARLGAAIAAPAGDGLAAYLAALDDEGRLDYAAAIAADPGYWPEGAGPKPAAADPIADAAPADGGRIVLSRGDPMASAQKFKSISEQAGDVFVRWRDTFYRWDGRRYCAMSDGSVADQVWRFLADAYVMVKDDSGIRYERYKPGTSNVTNFIGALKAIIGISENIEEPGWITAPNGDFKPEDIIAVKNGLYHIKSGALHPHTRNFFNLGISDVDIDPGAEPPARWLKFLDEVLPGDPEAIAALQEAFGYLLSSDTSQQKIFYLNGVPRSGKGTIQRVLIKLVGESNVVSPGLGTLKGDFGLEPWIGKKLCIFPDAPTDRERGSSSTTESLKSVSGEDTQSINRKNKSFWTGKLPTRIGVNRDALSDFADIGIALDPECMAKLESWHADFALRAMLSNPARIKQMGDLPAGIDRAAFEAFVSGEGDLPEAAKADLRSRLAHGGAPAKRGDDLPAFIASAQLPAEARRRAHLMHALRDLPLDELERLVGAARKAA